MERLTAPEQKRPDWRTALAVVIAASFLGRIALILLPQYEQSWQMYFNTVCAGMAAPVLFLTPAARQRGMRILLLAYGWIVFVCLVHIQDYTDPELLIMYMMMAAVSIGLLYPAAFVFSGARAERVFRFVALGYCILIAALAAITLFCGFSGLVVPSPGGVEYFGAGVIYVVNGYALLMFCNRINAGLYCAVSLILLAILFSQTRRVRTRVFYGVLAAILFTMLSVTDARTTCWSFCIAAGGLAYLAADGRMNAQKTFVRFCLSAACALAAAAVLFFAIRIVGKTLMPLMPRLPALRDAGTKATTLTGRTDIWKAVIDYLRHEPITLLTGTGPYRGIGLVQPFFTLDDTILPHAHSIVLQTLLTLGVPGLLLFVSFAVYVLYHAVRLFFFGRAACTFAERALPLIPVLCLAVDLVETFLSFSGSGDHSNAWFFFAAGYVVYAATNKLPRRKLSARAGENSHIGGEGWNV